MSETSHHGQCRCGAVLFTATGAPLITMACHCTGCQRMSASAFSLSSLYPADQFRITCGEVVRGGLKTGPNHQFCANCMTWLFTVPEGMESFVNVRSPMFDDAIAHRPFMETFRVEGMPWANSGAVRSYDALPEESEFPGLMTAYAEWDGRVMQ